MAVIGVDLGTTSTCVAVWQPHTQRAKVIPDEYDNNKTPSWVYYSSSRGVCIVGNEAKKLALTYPENIIFDSKRLIGKTDGDSVKGDKSNPWPFEVIFRGNGKPVIRVPCKNGHQTFAAEEVSATILAVMKSIAENRLGHVEAAVVTIPAHFNDAQRGATMAACRIAGFDEDKVKLVEKDTAAALAYSIDSGASKSKKNVLVFNLGSCASTARIFEIKGTQKSSLEGTFDVLGKSTDENLSGNYFTQRLMNVVVDRFCHMYKNQISSDDIWRSVESVRRIRDSCEKAKLEFSKGNNSVKIVVDPLIEYKEFHTIVTSQEFREINADLFERCGVVVDECLNDAKTIRTDIDDVILVGGSTQIPQIKRWFKDNFKCKTTSLDVDVDGGAAARGAAILAKARFGTTNSRSTLKVPSNDDRAMSVMRTDMEIRTMKNHVSSIMSIGEDLRKTVEMKGQFDTSTKVIKDKIRNPNTLIKLREKKKMKSPEDTLERVEAKVSEMEIWSKDNMPNDAIKASYYKRKMNDMFQWIRVLSPILWEIIKIALAVAGVVTTFL